MDQGKFDIKGISEDVEDIYIFFKNMKDSLIDNQLRLHKLEMLSDSIDDAVIPDGPVMYNFEITNMSEGDLNPSAKPKTEAKAAPAAGTNPNPAGSPAAGAARKVNDLEPVDIGP